MEAIDPNIKIIRETVEYYLSDKNLETDKFFNDKLSKNKGKVPIDDILSCNKIKKAKVDKNKLIEMINSSDKIKVTEDKLFVFRIGNTKIPDLKIGGKRLLPEVDDPSIFIEKDITNPFVLKIEGPPKSETSWREIEDEFKKIYPKFKIIYSRFKDGEGHLAISSYKKEDELKEEKFPNLKIKNDEFKFSLLDEKDKKSFWENHGTHFKTCLEKKITISSKIKSEKKLKKAAKEQKTSGPTKASFGGYVYNDLSKVRSKARTILNLKKNSETLDESEFKFVILK